MKSLSYMLTILLASLILEYWCGKDKHDAQSEEFQNLSSLVERRNFKIVNEFVN